MTLLRESRIAELARGALRAWKTTLGREMLAAKVGIDAEKGLPA